MGALANFQQLVSWLTPEHLNVDLHTRKRVQAARRIHADPETAALPIIALTASAFESDRAKALAAGCTDFDTNPSIWRGCWGRWKRC